MSFVAVVFVVAVVSFVWGYLTANDTDIFLK